jgi:hypothetical protein
MGPTKDTKTRYQGVYDTRRTAGLAADILAQLSHKPLA